MFLLAPGNSGETVPPASPALGSPHLFTGEHHGSHFNKCLDKTPQCSTTEDRGEGLATWQCWLISNLSFLPHKPYGVPFGLQGKGQSFSRLPLPRQIGCRFLRVLGSSKRFLLLHCCPFLSFPFLFLSLFIFFYFLSLILFTNFGSFSKPKKNATEKIVPPVSV